MNFQTLSVVYSFCDYLTFTLKLYKRAKEGILGFTVKFLFFTGFAQHQKYINSVDINNILNYF